MVARTGRNYTIAMNRIYFDLESSPLPVDQLTKLMPTEFPTGNTKDPEKLKAAIAAKQSEWMDNAALSAATGKIIAVTIAENNNEPEFITGEEPALIERALSEISDPGITVFGWNLHNFDLKFLAQRASVHGIKGFSCLTTVFRGRRSWCEHLIDAMQVWNMAYGHVSGSSLGAVALALGVGEKTGNGKDFADLLKTDPDAARAYAVNDVCLLRKIVERLGI